MRLIRRSELPQLESKHRPHTCRLTKNPTEVSLIIVNGKGVPEFIQMIGASDPILPKEIQAECIKRLDILI